MTKQKDFKVIYLDDDYAKIKGKCILTGEDYQTRKFPITEWITYLSGSLIQKAMPDMSADDREFIISGVSPEAFDGLFEDRGNNSEK